MKQEKYEQNMRFMQSLDLYNKYLVTRTQKYLGKRVLDAGCGIGNTATHIPSCVLGIDVSDVYLQQFRKNLKIPALKMDLGSSIELKKLTRYRVDSVFCSNVLEHIKNDVEAMKNIHRILPKNGRAIIIVPQYSWLYTRMDKEDLHFRRYSKGALKKKLKKHNAEFKVVKNTLFERAMDAKTFEPLKAHLEGPTGIVLGFDDPVGPVKVLAKFISDNEKPSIKAGIFEGKLSTPEEFVAISKLPSREELLSKVVGGMQSPIRGLVYVLNGTISKLVYALQACCCCK